MEVIKDGFFLLTLIPAICVWATIAIFPSMFLPGGNIYDDAPSGEGVFLNIVWLCFYIPLTVKIIVPWYRELWGLYA